MKEPLAERDAGHAQGPVGLDYLGIRNINNAYWNLTTNEVDYIHMNAIEMDYDGNILFSSRHFSEITKILGSHPSPRRGFG